MNLKKTLEVVVPLFTAVMFYVGSKWMTAPSWFLGLAWGLSFWYLVVGLGKLAQVTGLAKRLSLEKLTANYTTRDIMVMAALIAVGGIFKAEWGKIRMAVEPLGPFSALIVAPGFYFWGVLGAYLVRKPLSGTISMTLGGVVEILMGNPYGLPVLLFNLWEGLGPDIGVTLFRFRRYNVLVAVIGCLIGSVFGVFYSGFTAGFTFLDDRVLLLQRILGFVGAALGGLLGAMVAKGLERVGVRRSSELMVEDQPA